MQTFDDAEILAARVWRQLEPLEPVEHFRPKSLSALTYARSALQDYLLEWAASPSAATFGHGRLIVIDNFDGPLCPPIPEECFKWTYNNCWRASLEAPQTIIQSALSPTTEVPQILSDVDGAIPQPVQELRRLLRYLSAVISALLRLTAICPVLRTTFQTEIRWHLNHGCHPPAVQTIPHLFSPGWAA